MELGNRIREYRNAIPMTQEELAERMYVSRQTISNWENDKSYPDIHSLLMLSDLFDVSLDILVKGDIETMKEKIDKAEIARFGRDSNLFSLLVVATVATPLLLFKWAGALGLAAWALLCGAMLFFGVRVEKAKKRYDMYTYREIVAFMNGETLDGIEKAREEGKRNYQKVILCLASGILALLFTLAVTAVFFKG